ncbi:hypothetical protein EDWATA_02804 [Edwardsiella tarda ATCC 23685]|uniref:Uncharacterized protein n=1 Tax=Edwardsiella tarda ATCC 23685 TaxID=500638 RepID=D4F7R8_EDWTA|nr:hypothetical protein EDWATA_02804 [Edwardsiella tarda ATCC 23685]
MSGETMMHAFAHFIDNDFYLRNKIKIVSREKRGKKNKPAQSTGNIQ